jgi:hypothetical protein
MKTHNSSIYHCISCGRVVHAEELVEQEIRLRGNEGLILAIE